MVVTPPNIFGRAVVGIVVQEGPAAGELVLEVRQLATAGAAVDIILAADGEPDAVAGRDNDRRRPDFDVQFGNIAWLQRLLLVVRVVRPPRLRQLLVELAMRGAQPTL